MNKFVVRGPSSHRVPAHLSYARYLFDNLRAHGERTALIDAESGASCSYSALLQQAVELASGLRARGLSRGDIVAVCSENRTELAITIIAVIFCGATVATASPVYTQLELTFVLNLSKPKFVFCSPKALNLQAKIFMKLAYVKEVFVFEDSTGILRNRSNFAKLFIRTDVSTFNTVDVNGKTDVMSVLSSSGTTGLPKGAMQTHLNSLASAIDHYVRFKSPELQSVLTFAPWHHAFGFVTTLDLLNAGKTLVYISRYQEKLFYEIIQKYRINLVLSVPTVLVAMSKSKILDKYNLKSIKHIFSSAGPLNSETILALKKRIPTISAITQGYGMTENMCPFKTDDDAPAGCAGKPIPGVLAKVVSLETGQALGPNQRGEICIKGDYTMKGYIGDPAANEAAFDEDGYYKTGDVGYYTEDRVFYVVDRVKELIKYKGNQVPPAEVEAVLLKHPGVQESCVVGAPDELAGELPTAFVVRCPGSSVTAEELQQLVADQLSNPKRLRGGVRFVEELPRNPAGKVLRRLLKEKYFQKPASKL